MELVTYDAKSCTMDVTFKSGSVYRYLFVFPATFETFRQSPTHDAYYARAVKGRLASIPVRKHSHGREEKTPLKAKTQRGSLDRGIAGIKRRIDGTAGRAFGG